MEPPWLVYARADIGVREIPGKADSPVIRRWLIDLNAWWTDDATPWCGVAVAHWMRRADIQRPKNWFRALAWIDWGVRLGTPALGCVVVFKRPGGGHVGLVAGEDIDGNLMVIGGNQSDAVSLAPFARDRVVGYRWPPDEVADWPHLMGGTLPLLAHNAPMSRNEA